MFRALFPDAAFVDNFTPGSSPKAQLEFGARQLAAGSSGLLISHVGVAKLMGAPLRTLCLDARIANDRVWLASQAGKHADEAALLFAHFGNKAVDAAAAARLGQAYVSRKAEVAALPESAGQVQLLIAR